MSAIPNTVSFDSAARIPVPGDNVAIATRRLEGGTVISTGETDFKLPHTVMEGHRFVLEPIAEGGNLLSWGLPFGTATRDIAPGEYCCNEKILGVLAERDIDFELPGDYNFVNYSQPHVIDEDTFQAGEQVVIDEDGAYFQGYVRPGGRGAGTRNFIVVLATTAPTAGFCTALAGRFQGQVKRLENVDGVVAVTHTEGGGSSTPNNLEFVLRTLAGFVVHANVAAVLAVDYGNEPFNNDTLKAYLDEGGYPLAHVPHEFMRLSGSFESELDRGATTIEGWLEQVARQTRTPQSVANLKLALQCGGSDAFSGISGNALAGWVAKQVVGRGGAANLGETDELIGAEPYVLKNVSSLGTAQKFLEKIEIFKERVENHGASAEGNPSGGNNYRGLYNITLKSIGAARKKDPDVRLDYVIDYSEPMRQGGYYFMDSPGNDLESIAGQVAAGSNLILFITGNGSITNFPFVPTLKFVTTTGRFEMLQNEMDVNAGRYNDGMSMDALGQETFELALSIASGQRSKGELAGHAQVQVWRDWMQTDDSQLEALQSLPKPLGAPLGVVPGPASDIRFEALRTEQGLALDQVGLIMPTSLCSGQVARLIADHMNARSGDGGAGSRYVALVHTEGCGSANADSLFLQTLLGHLQNPHTRRAMMLEHGCERTHNDAVRHYLREQGLEESHFGFSSVQLDGGITSVTDKVVEWFDSQLGDAEFPSPETTDASALRLGLTGDGPVSEMAAGALGELARGLVAGGATVVIPDNASLLTSDLFKKTLIGEAGVWQATLAYGEPAAQPGLHLMEAPTESAVETLTGLGGAGAELMLAHAGRGPLQTHPMIALLQVSAEPKVLQHYAQDLDLDMSEMTGHTEAVRALSERISAAASRTYVPKMFGRGVAGFQLTRGLLGVSL